MSRLGDALRCWALRRLQVPCGAHGGGDDFAGKGRWCVQPFGHYWSCSFENQQQPLWELRRRQRGWR